MSTPRSPIDTMLDTVDFRCVICNAKMGQCDCWVKCECGRSYRKGETCPAPLHKKKASSS